MLEHRRAFAELDTIGLSSWANPLRDEFTTKTNGPMHGHWEKWQKTLDKLPDLVPSEMDFESAEVTFNGDATDADRRSLRSALQTFHPWRKGPFQLFGLTIDSEWRSNLKWERVVPHIDLRNKTILDVGCGNGYYGWRMLGAGARCVIGLEPHLPYVVQHAAIKRYAPKHPNHVIYAADEQIDQLDYFDTVFSMGVLYHCRKPQTHLNLLRQALTSGGTLVLETLVVPDAIDTVLAPKRYAKMRNVWYLPSLDHLTDLVRRAGFSVPNVVDVTRTTANEQRSTEWMTFESLPNFLSPTDESQTLEGYPAPTRAIMTATRQ